MLIALNGLRWDFDNRCRVEVSRPALSFFVPPIGESSSLVASCLGYGGRAIQHQLPRAGLFFTALPPASRVKLETSFRSEATSGLVQRLSQHSIASSAGYMLRLNARKPPSRQPAVGAPPPLFSKNLGSHYAYASIKLHSLLICTLLTALNEILKHCAEASMRRLPLMLSKIAFSSCPPYS